MAVHPTCRNLLRRGQQQQNISYAFSFPAPMAPSMPLYSPKRGKYDNINRAHSFDTYNTRSSSTSLGQVCRKLDFKLPTSTARSRLNQCKNLGSPALRRTRNLAYRLGRKCKVSTENLKKITNQEGLIHEESYAEQAQTLDGKPTAQTLQHHTAHEGARRFKKGYTSEILDKNKGERMGYRTEHKGETLTGFWQYIWFTDEVTSLSKATK
jgi:hypothetical protein